MGSGCPARRGRGPGGCHGLRRAGSRGFHLILALLPVLIVGYLAAAAPAWAQVGPPEPFNVTRAMGQVSQLATGIGIRNAGTDGERRAGDYLRGALADIGYAPSVQTFPLPNGRQSRNVVAVLPGRHPDTIVLGAHYDTKGASPGANDNGTGTAALLELARHLKDETLDVTVVFVFFGAEETVDANPDHHHYGSRHYVRAMDAAARTRTKAMISVDMIGYGPEFRVRTMGRGPQSLRDQLLGVARSRGLPLSYLRDPGSSGWSDHEPFELAGIPAAWLEWRDDPYYHTSKDTAGHIVAEKVRVTGQLCLDFVRQLEARDLLFHDVALSSPYRTAILELHARGVVSGYADNSFHPGQGLLRAQFAKMMVLALDLPVDESLVAPFGDLPPELPGDLYPHDYVAAAAADGLVRGIGPGRFGPFVPVTRAQVVTMTVRAVARHDPGTLRDPPAGYRGSWPGLEGEHGSNARLAEYNGLLRGLPLTSTARDPWAPMPRGEAARVVWNLLLH